MIANILELLGIAFMLLLAFAFQIFLHELPCPLCLLQRIGFLCVILGLLLNLRFGARPSHYALTILSTLLTSFIALRQIALHVIPGTGSYGNAILGLHLYTWSFIISMGVLIATTCLLGIDRQYQTAHKNNIRWAFLTHGLFILILFLIITNLISVFLECGFSQCPDNPVQYELLGKI